MKGGAFCSSVTANLPCLSIILKKSAGFLIQCSFPAKCRLLMCSGIAGKGWISDYVISTINCWIYGHRRRYIWSIMFFVWMH